MTGPCQILALVGGGLMLGPTVGGVNETAGSRIDTLDPIIAVAPPWPGLEVNSCSCPIRPTLTFESDWGCSWTASSEGKAGIRYVDSPDGPHEHPDNHVAVIAHRRPGDRTVVGFRAARQMCPDTPYSFHIWYRTVDMMSFRIAFAGEDWVDRVVPSWTAVPIADGEWHSYCIRAITMSKAELDRYPNLVVVYEGVGWLFLDDGTIAPFAADFWLAQRPRRDVRDKDRRSCRPRRHRWPRRG